MEYIKSIFELIFPTKDLCYFCNSTDLELENYICKSCYENLDIMNEEVFLESKYIKKCYYSAIYNKYMREIIKRFKFKDMSYLYKPLGALLLSTIEEKKIDAQIDLIAFVPSHRRKEAIRGYNQSELLASFIARELNIPVFNGLKKTQHTRDQHFLDLAARKDNLKNAFKIDRVGEIEDKRVLLIDDILTSGNTMEEVSSCLIKNKARAIIALALTSARNI